MYLLEFIFAIAAGKSDQEQGHDFRSWANVGISILVFAIVVCFLMIAANLLGFEKFWFRKVEPRVFLCSVLLVLAVSIAIGWYFFDHRRTLIRSRFAARLDRVSSTAHGAATILLPIGAAGLLWLGIRHPVETGVSLFLVLITSSVVSKIYLTSSK